MCEGHDYCKKREEIIDWIQGKYIVLLFNQVRFEQEEFGTDTRVQEARILYIPVSSQVRQLIPFRVNVADLYLQDNMNIELDELTLDIKKGLFKLEQITTYPYEQKNNVWVSVTVERNLANTEF